MQERSPDSIVGTLNCARGDQISSWEHSSVRGLIGFGYRYAEMPYGVVRFDLSHFHLDIMYLGVVVGGALYMRTLRFEPSQPPWHLF